MSIRDRVLDVRFAKLKKRIQDSANELPCNDLYEMFVYLGNELQARNLREKETSINLQGYSYSELVDLFECLAEDLKLPVSEGERMCQRFILEYSRLMSNGYGYILEKEQAYSILVLVLDSMNYLGDYSALGYFLNNTLFK